MKVFPVMNQGPGSIEEFLNSSGPGINCKTLEVLFSNNSFDWTNLWQIWMKIHKFSLTQMHLRMPSVKCNPFCPGLDELMVFHSFVCVSILSRRHYDGLDQDSGNTRASSLEFPSLASSHRFVRHSSCSMESGRICWELSLYIDSGPWFSWLEVYASMRSWYKLCCIYWDAVFNPIPKLFELLLLMKQTLSAFAYKV